MKLTTITSDKNLPQLAKRLYNISGAANSQPVKDAVAALITANPWLSDVKDLAKVPPGTIVVAPALPGGPAAGGGTAEDLVAALLAPLPPAVDMALGASRQASQQALDSLRQRDTALRKVLESGKAPAAEAAAIKKALPRIEAEIAERDKALSEAADRDPKTMGALAEDAQQMIDWLKAELSQWMMLGGGQEG